MAVQNLDVNSCTATAQRSEPQHYTIQESKVDFSNDITSMHATICTFCITFHGN